MRIRPRFWGLCYLSCIPIFAFIFSLFPTDFYHSTATNETEFKRVQSRLLQRLDPAFSEFCTSTIIKDHLLTRDLSKIGEADAPLTQYRIEQCNANTSRVYLDGTRVIVEGSLSFLMDWPIHPNIDIAAFQAEIVAPGEWFDDKLELIKSTDPDGWEKHRFSTPIHVTILQPALFVEEHNKLVEIFPEPLDRRSSAYFETVDLVDLRDFSDASNGTPVGLEGSLVRMLYLSAVTITTLGYGDIVPITSRARLLVAIESVLGIVLIGLFLSSVSENIVSRKD